MTHYCLNCAAGCELTPAKKDGFAVCAKCGSSATVPQVDDKNRTFDTGAWRDNSEGKGRCDLLPPDGLLALAKHFESGAKKYGPSNWKKGMPQHVLIDSGLRHLLKYMAGQTDEDHLNAACWNIICALDQRERAEKGTLDKGLMDVPLIPK